MSKHDFETALGLVKQQGISFRALIMAALLAGDRDAYKKLREKFPDIAHEYWDRRDGIRGFLRGENPQADHEYTRRDAMTEELPIRTRTKRYTNEEQL